MMKAVNFLLGSILALPLFAHADALKLQKSTQEFDQYRGQITVNGEYSYYFDDEVAGDVICFHPSAPSDQLIPRKPDDRRSRWFCFRDTQQAAQALKLNKRPKEGYIGYTGHAIVTVGEYAVYKGESDGTDLAKLVSVQKADTPKLVKSSGY